MSALSPSLLDLACVRLGTRAWNTQARRSISSGAFSARRNMHDYAPSSASGSSSSDHGHAPAFDQRASYPAGGSNGHRNYKRSTLGALSVRPQPSTSKQVLPENEHTQLHMQEHTDIMDELQQRIDKLQKLDLKEDADSLDAHINADTAAFSEDELMNFYQDVLALPEENVPAVSAPDAVSEHENDLELVQGLHQRLLDPVISSESAPSTSTTEVETTASSPSPSPHATILAYIRDNVSADTQIQETESLDAVKTLGITQSEWEALARIAASEQDGLSTVETLRLMIHSGFEPSEPLLNVCMNVFARTGDVPATEAFMQRFLTDTPTEPQRDMHVKAHLRSVSRGTTPRSALALLHSYEARALPAPIKTYSRAIGALFAVRPPDTTSTPGSTPAESESPRQAHAQAWDLFVHMRYAAHPTPDLMLYTQMLRACALPASGRTSVFSPLGTAEPERALDLWHEMTVEQGLVPNMLAYEAVISACARSGEERYVDEAFRLAKECLDGERDAHGRARFSATPSLCRALLDGAKRVGALGRARWILAEMIRVARTKRAEEVQAEGETQKREVVVDEQTMMHVFHAYSSYVPPFKRALAKIVDGEEVPVVKAAEGELDPQDLVREALSPQPSPAEQTSDLSADPDSEAGSAASVSGYNNPQAANEINLIHGPQFPTHVPQSHAEVLAEASFLFARILAAQGSPASSASAPDSSAAPEDALDTSDFSDVRLSPRLVNAFLSVFYAHGSTEVCRVLWRDIWAQVASLGPGPSAPVSTSSEASATATPTPRVFLPLAPIARSYVEALERCSNAERGHDREVAFAWAQEMWPAWLREEAAWRAGRATLPGLDYRMIERAHTAMIRMLAVNEQLDKALTHLRGFVATYPPRAVRKTPPKDEMRSTRTLLIGPNPLVRLTSPVHVADDRVPPILTFGDLEIVHHRLQAVGDAKGVGYVHWVCKAYEGELRRRREKMLLSEGRKGKAGIVAAS